MCVRERVCVVFTTSWCQGLADRLIKLTTGNKCFLSARHLSHLAPKCHWEKKHTHTHVHTDTCTHRVGLADTQEENRRGTGATVLNVEGERGRQREKEEEDDERGAGEEGGLKLSTIRWPGWFSTQLLLLPSFFKALRWADSPR